MKRMLSLAFVFSLVIGFAFQLCSPLQAAPAVDVSSEANRYSLDSAIGYLEDKSGQLGIDEILGSSSFLQWKTSRISNLNFGFSRSTYWFHIKLLNQGQAIPENLALVVNNALLDEVTLYIVDDSSLQQTMETGDSKPFLQRPNEHLTFVFSLTVPSNRPVSLFLRVRSEGSVQVPLSLWNNDYYHHHEEREVIIQSIYFGILIFIIFFNLFVYLRTFAASHLFFVLYVLSTGLLMAGLSGYGYKYLWQPFTAFQEQHVALLACLAGVFLSAFIFRILDLRKKRPVTSRLMLLMIGAFTILLLLTPFMSYHLIIQLTLPMFFVPLAIGLYGGIRHWKTSNSANTYFTIAWAQFLIFIMAVQLAKFGIIPQMFLTNDILPWRLLAQIVLLSMALGERMNSERRQRVQAQKKIIHMQKFQEKELRKQVIERTLELGKANEELEKLAATDPLTGIYNRRRFLDQAEHLLNISIRHQHPIAMVMIDIDHFKVVNDTYGHAAGDHALCQIAQTLSLCSRKTDVVGRVGGEEFAILLFDVSSSTAEMLVERIRSTVEIMQIVYEEQLIPLTISAGLCISLITRQDMVIGDLMKIADDGLYHAKHQGRNQVVTLDMPVN